jgi:hypothetical protein
MSPPGCGSGTISVPFLEGTVPPRDNVHGADQWHPGGCFDIVRYVQQAGRPALWVTAAAGWGDKFNGGGGGSRYAIGQVPGRGGYGAPICGEVEATPTPEPTPEECNFNNPNCPRPSGCPPWPLPCDPDGDATAPVAEGTPIDAAVLVPVFAVPVAAGLVPYLVRLARRRH